jgi:DNA-binding transcriptional LysR family regulator
MFRRLVRSTGPSEEPISRREGHVRIEQLEYLAAVIQHGSLRRAGESLHLSQPALSEALGNLERELGVTLLERRRAGARISSEGRGLLPYMAEVLSAVDRLREAAGDESVTARTLRVGTVSAAGAAVLVPAVQDFRRTHPATVLEVVSAQHQEILDRLEEGALDLGLVNVLAGDDLPRRLRADVLLRGRPVACLPTDHPLAEKETVTVEELREQSFVTMRPGYLMHRYASRLFGSTPPSDAFSADGAEMGKLMVAQGLGVTILPDYSLVDDPLCRAGLVTWRPIDDGTEVRLLLLVRDGAGRVLGELRTMFVTQARRHTERAV